MLKRLELKNCFKHTHRVIDFTTGLTAITGPNESGKSLIFEMISYALFGSVALRGAADDYKKMQVTLDFEVSGKSYSVHRAGSKALLKVEGLELATGTKVVNPKIVEILGYDYKVFSIANCANQDELTKLGTMKPTERKQMVDNVIGLTIIDKLQAFVSGKVSELSVQVDTMQTNLLEPVLPEKPEDYVPQPELQVKINELSIKEQRFNYLNNWLSVTRPVPVAPTNPGFGKLEDLQEKYTALNNDITKARELELQVNRHTPAFLTSEQVQDYKKQWEKFDELALLQARFLRFAPKPIYSKEELDKWAKQAEQWGLWQQKKELLGHGENNCPKCKHKWPVAAEQLEKYKDVEECMLPKIVPIPAHYSAISVYEAETPARIELEARIAALGQVPTPTITKSVLDAQERSIADFEHIAEVKAELLKLQEKLSGGQPDYRSMISQQQFYETQMAVYVQAVTDYNQWVKEFQANSEEIKTLSGTSQLLQNLRNILTQVIIYDQQLLQYERSMLTYNNMKATIAEKSNMLNQYERVKIALKEARSTVKKYLVPSLNRVASALLAQMTGGSRSHVEVSEDFDITIDGQPLNTLSGSGKAVANLAIRIALGQVLIAKKFPVFMADEIDGSMDADRAEFTSECLRRLTKHVPQLLLISHKRPEADHYIELGR